MSGTVLHSVTVSCYQIVTECDKGVRKMKCIEELVSLEPLIDFGKVKVSTFLFPH